MYDRSLKFCPNCNKMIDASTIKCKHCGADLTKIKEQQKNNENVIEKGSSWMLFGQICFILGFSVLLVHFWLDICYHITHMNPVETACKQPIDTAAEAKQIEIEPETIDGPAGSKLITQAYYSLSGLVITKNMNFGLKGVTYNDFDKVVPLDLGIVWGKLASPNKLEHLKFKSRKLEGIGRQLEYTYDAGIKLDAHYINSHISHNHIIPANDNIAGGLLKIKKGSKIKLKGKLVDINYAGGNSSKTSLSRTDNNLNSRGDGACEIFYVTSLQIEDKCYK